MGRTCHFYAQSDCFTHVAVVQGEAFKTISETRRPLFSEDCEACVNMIVCSISINVEASFPGPFSVQSLIWECAWPGTRLWM